MAAFTLVNPCCQDEMDIQSIEFAQFPNDRMRINITRPATGKAGPVIFPGSDSEIEGDSFTLSLAAARDLWTKYAREGYTRCRRVYRSR